MPGQPESLTTIEIESATSEGEALTKLVDLLDFLDEVDDRVVLLIGDGRGLLFPGPLADNITRRTFARVCDAIAGHRLPVIGVTEGAVTDSALDILLACDLRFCRSDSAVGFPSARDGFLPVGGATRLARLGGASLAARALLLGETFTAEREAHLSAFLFPSADPVGAAHAAAQRLAGAGPLALEAVKASLGMHDVPLKAGLSLEADLGALLLPTSDRAEGLQAFFERREPDFRGE